MSSVYRLLVFAMLLQWSHHSKEMADRLGDLLARESLLDITLTAEGKYIKAHKVVLAAASKYFEVRTDLIQTILRVLM